MEEVMDVVGEDIVDVADEEEEVEIVEEVLEEIFRTRHC